MALETSPPLVVKQYQGCVDVRGQSIPHGLLFAPGPDECLVCTCFNGTPGLCRTMFCAPPSNCKSIRMGDGCCEWICLEKYPEDRPRTPDDDGVVAADVNLRLVASAVTAICSVALLFFLIYRLRKKKRQRRNGNRNDDAMSLDSQMPPPPPHSFPMAAMPPPPHHANPPPPTSGRSYWLTWWKPSSNNNEDAFDARPAPPPSYDAAMMHAVTDPGRRGAPSRAVDFDYDYEAEGDDDDSVSGASQAPPYSEIHHDPIIPDWVNPVATAQPISLPPPQQATDASFAASAGLPETAARDRRHVVPRAGAALVLPVRPPDLGALGGGRLRRPRSQMESRQAESLPEGGGRGHRHASSSSSGRRPLHSTLPSGVLMNLNARSREGIVVPPSLPAQDRDAALQRFSLQLQLNISDSSDSSNSAFEGVAEPSQDRESPASSSSISSIEQQ